MRNHVLVLLATAGLLIGPTAGVVTGWWAGQHYAATGDVGPQGPAGPIGPRGQLVVQTQHNRAESILTDMPCPPGTHGIIEGSMTNENGETYHFCAVDSWYLLTAHGGTNSR